MRIVSIFSLLLLIACTPQAQNFQALPEGKVELAADAFHAADGAVLPLRSWVPKNPRAVIVALHGFNDYSHAFEDPGEYLQSQNMAVYAYDQRGFGEAPQTGIWASEENLAADLKQFVSLVYKRHPKKPVFLLGESMGGAVAISALSDPEFKVAGVILVAPAVWGAETMHPLYRSTLWLAANTLPFYTLTGEGLNILASDNIDMLKQMGKDPLVIKKTRIDAIYGLVQIMDSAYDKVEAVDTPVLLLYGACDQVIPPEPIARVKKQFNAPLTFAYYPEGYHMLLRDLQGDRVLNDIVSWMRSPRKPLPSGFALSDDLKTKSLDHTQCLVLRPPSGGSRYPG